jgi:hypothetical protein
MPSEPQANGAEDAPELELDALVAEELRALGPPAEEAVEQLIARLAARLRAHPDRAALLAGLRREVLGPTDEAPPPPSEPPAEG